VTHPLRVFAFAVLQAALFLAIAPLLRGAIKRMKASFQTRQGPPLLQGYYDLAKMFAKESVRSETASWVFVAGPRVYFATVVAATTLVPLALAAAPLEAAGGVLVLVGLLAMGRFALAAGALDTGSPFGGMGSSREMTVGALAEPALMLGLFTIALSAGSLNLGELARTGAERGPSFQPSEILAAAGLFLVLIAETGRIPVDNPATHLELTMIHEAMLLEYSGPYLALLEWGAAVKLLVFFALAANLFMPWGIAVSLLPGALVVGFVSLIAKLGILAVAVAVLETRVAKLRLFRVPELLSASFVLALLAVMSTFLAR
jgi:formate hydrogenlyase subunit 4